MAFKNEKAEGQLKLHTKQQSFSDAIVKEVINNPQDKEPVFLSSLASAGSGKTATLVSSAVEMTKHFQKNIKYEIINGETSNIPVKKALIVAFNKEMKKKLEKDFGSNSEIQEDFFEITTVNSLFFRRIKQFENEESKTKGFELNYKQSTFSKNDISFFVESLLKGGTPLSASVDSKISFSRPFIGDTLATEKNIDILWSLVNMYFSSPFSPSQMKLLEESSEFFGKKKVSLKDIDIDSDDIEKIKRTIKSRNLGNKEPKQFFFEILIKRIEQLAVAREVEIRKETKRFEVPVEKVDASGNVVGVDTQVFEREEEVVELLGNIITVPHCFYYKKFYNKIMSDVDFSEKVFGQYNAILIDEAQDNDRIVFQILVHLAKNKIVRNFAFVGDPLQGIYAFKSPDHFDLLSFIQNNEEYIRKQGIKYEEHPLDITFRFGAPVANFVNSIFNIDTKSTVNRNSFVYPETIDMNNIARISSTLAEMDSSSLGIVCRSNAEAMKIYVELKSKGVENVIIQASAKDELKAFVKNGIQVITRENVKSELMTILSKEQGEECGYIEILSNATAIAFLANNGYSNLVRFSKDEIDKYILPASRKRKNVITIGTAHLFKGAEFNNVIVAGDFFKQDDNFNFAEIAESYAHEEIPLSSEMGVIDDLFGEKKEVVATIKDTKEESAKEPLVLDEVTTHYDDQVPFVDLFDNQEEMNIYYVALTRAKDGVFFMPSAVENQLKFHIDPNQTIPKYITDVVNNTIEIKEETKEEITESLGLFEKYFTEGLSSPSS